MILNKEKTIQIIADFLSDYINSTSLKSFYIQDGTNLNLNIKICERARRKCGAQIYLIWKDSEEDNYEFAKHIGDADKHNCLIVSGLCKTDSINRSFYKYDSDKLADIYPLLDLYKSEIIQIGGTKDLHSEHKDIEYADRQNEQNGIIISKESPLKHEDWFKYTKHQKEVIAKMHAREKSTRHKDLVSRGAIYPRLRNLDILK